MHSILKKYPLKFPNSYLKCAPLIHLLVKSPSTLQYIFVRRWQSTKGLWMSTANTAWRGKKESEWTEYGEHAAAVGEEGVSVGWGTWISIEKSQEIDFLLPFLYETMSIFSYEFFMNLKLLWTTLKTFSCCVCLCFQSHFFLVDVCFF